MYKDLLFKNKESFLYFKKINKCIKEHFYPKLIFALKYYYIKFNLIHTLILSICISIILYTNGIL